MKDLKIGIVGKSKVHFEIINSEFPHFHYDRYLEKDYITVQAHLNEELVGCLLFMETHTY